MRKRLIARNKLLEKLQGPSAPTWFGGDSVGKLAPKNLIFNLEVTDLASQFFVRRRGDHFTSSNKGIANG